MTDRRTQTRGLVQSVDILVGQGLFDNWISGVANDVSDDQDDDEYDASGSCDDELDEIERLFRDSSDDFGWEEEERRSVEDSVERLFDDNDWEESSFDDKESTDILSGDENNYEIRKLGNAPSWDSLKSLSTSNINSINAISSSHIGLNFMISRQGVQNNDVEGITRWHLADDSVHNPVDDSSSGVQAEIKPTTMKQLRREILPRDSVYYMNRDGDRLNEKNETE